MGVYNPAEACKCQGGIRGTVSWSNRLHIGASLRHTAVRFLLAPGTNNFFFPLALPRGCSRMKYEDRKPVYECFFVTHDAMAGGGGRCRPFSLLCSVILIWSPLLVQRPESTHTALHRVCSSGGRGQVPVCMMKSRSGAPCVLLASGIASYLVPRLGARGGN